MEDRYVDTVLGRIRLRVGGSGPAMLFWPSLLMDGMLWAGQADHFADRFQVVLVDPPGHGASSPLTKPFTFDQCGPLVKPVIDAFLGPTTRRTKPDVVASVNDSVRRVAIDSGRHAVLSVVPHRPDQRELFGRIRTPVLVVAGIEDATFPVAETRVMAEAIPGARFVVLEGAAHLAALECPAEVNALIDAFLLAQS